MPTIRSKLPAEVARWTKRNRVKLSKPKLDSLIRFIAKLEDLSRGESTCPGCGEFDSLADHSDCDPYADEEPCIPGGKCRCALCTIGPAEEGDY